MSASQKKTHNSLTQFVPFFLHPADVLDLLLEKERLEAALHLLVQPILDILKESTPCLMFIAEVVPEGNETVLVTILQQLDGRYHPQETVVSVPVQILNRRDLAALRRHLADAPLDQNLN